MGITLRSPQIELLMILVFISASLWGCLGCEELPDGNNINRNDKRS